MNRRAVRRVSVVGKENRRMAARRRAATSTQKSAVPVYAHLAAQRSRDYGADEWGWVVSHMTCHPETQRNGGGGATRMAASKPRACRTQAVDLCSGSTII